MELMMLAVYAGLCVAIFKIFRIPLNKWTVPTAILGGIILLMGALLVMNYNHPHTKLATQYYIATPIVPNVKGTVIEVAEIKPNQLVKKGDLLFKLDPTPYQAEVNAKKAALADAEQHLSSLDSDYKASKARLAETEILIKQKKKEYERYLQLAKMNAATPLEVEIREREYRSAEANLATRKAELAKIEGLNKVKVNGENTTVAQQRAALEKAQFELDATVVTAPTDGFVSQAFLKEGMMATTLPLRPMMTFIHQQPRQFVAAFRENSLLRLNVGNEAELAFPSIPGKVFPAKIVAILPAIGEHEVQAGGTSYTRRFIDQNAMPMVLFELEDDLSEYRLPYGATAEVAVYTEHFHHLATMRKVLLRMNSWKNYLYLDH